MDRRANFKIPRRRKININAVRYFWKHLVLDLDNSARAKLYVGKQLVFLGDGYMALKMFIQISGNDPAVTQKFKSQLQMREKLKWKEPKKDARDGMES